LSKYIDYALGQLRINQGAMQTYKNYYIGNHDILTSYKFEEARSNMKIICNYFKRFVNERVSYILSNPINYISKSGNEEIVNLIDEHFDIFDRLHDQALLKKALIYGYAYELQYLNNEGNFKTTSLSPMNCYAIEDGTVEKNILLGIHVWTNSFEDQEYMDVYTPDKIQNYKLNDNNYTLVKEYNNKFGKVPFIIIEANEERTSLLNDIKKLNDGINQVLSNMVNESNDFREAILAVVNATFDNDQITEMIKSGAIMLDKDGDMKWITKQIPSEFVSFVLDNLEEKIYKMSSTLDTNEKLQSNLSGVTMRSRLISLENVCSLLQAQIEKVIRQRLKNFFEIQRIKTNKKYNLNDIGIKFTPNIPQDLVGTADIITKLQNQVSQETLLSLLPFVSNPKLELEKFLKEKQLLEGIDLDIVGGNSG